MARWLTFVLYLVLAHVLVCLASDGPFWISTAVTDFQVNEDCLSKVCMLSQVRYKIIHSLPGHSEFSADWYSRPELLSRQFTSSWNDGNPDDVVVHLHVISDDPIYKFWRACDKNFTSIATHQVSTTTTTVLPFTRATRSSSEFENGNGDVELVEMSGHCFNATISVRKHRVLCPWCPTPPAFDFASSSSEELFWERLNDPVYFWPILIAIFLSLMVFGLAVTLVCVCALQRSHRTLSKSASPTCSNNRLIDSSSSESSGSFLHDPLRHPMPKMPVPQLPLSVEPHPEHVYECLSVPPNFDHRYRSAFQRWVSTDSGPSSTSYVSTPSPSVIDV